MNCRRIASLVTIVGIGLAVTVLPGAASAGSSGKTHYSGRTKKMAISADRTQRKVEFRINMKLKCNGIKDRWTTVYVKTRVNPNSGKFRFITPKSQRKIYVGAWFANIIGRFNGNRVAGRVGMVKSDHYSRNYTCHSGKSIKHLWVPFKARRK